MISTVWSSRSILCHLRRSNLNSLLRVGVRSFSAVPDREEPPKPAPNFLYRSLPASAHPYLDLARLDKPIGTHLLLIPCLWSTALAATPGGLPALPLFATFAAGAVIMRGAGCTINDMWDQDFDRRVERTTQRPLASGALTNRQALGFLAGQLSAGLGILLTLNHYTIALGASSMALVVTYPLAKRFTNWPQAVLGMVFNWGALVGWSAVHGVCAWNVCLPLYASGVCWSIFYDTIYAHQDKADDKKLGLKSTALHFGEDTKKYLALFGTGTVAGLALSGYMAGMGVPFFGVSVLGGAWHLARQVRGVDLNQPQQCMDTFVSNRDYGYLVLGGMVLDKLLQGVM